MSAEKYKHMSLQEILPCSNWLLCLLSLSLSSITTTIPLYVQVARTKVLGVFNPRQTRDSGAWGLEEVRIIEMGGIRAILIMSSQSQEGRPEGRREAAGGRTTMNKAAKTLVTPHLVLCQVMSSISWKVVWLRRTTFIPPLMSSERKWAKLDLKNGESFENLMMSWFKSHLMNFVFYSCFYAHKMKTKVFHG